LYLDIPISPFARTGNAVSSNAIGQKCCSFGQMRRLTKCTLQLHRVISLFGSIFRWDQKLRQTAQLRSQLELRLTNQSLQLVIAVVTGNSSLISLYFFVYF